MSTRPRSIKRPSLQHILCHLSLEVAFEVARARWPGVDLGYIGTDRNTFQHYFQEWGNKEPFIL